jgi:signal transduction histidine kinase
MDQDLPLLHKLFDHFPEPVFALHRLQVVYANPKGTELLSMQEEHFLITLGELLPQESGQIQCALEGGLYHITVSLLSPELRLLLLRPAKEVAAVFHHNNVSSILRGHLTNIAATTEHLAQQLNREQRLEAYSDLLSIQNQAVYRILRLARQMELSHGDWEQEFTMGMVDLAGVCRSIHGELSSRLGEEGPRFTYRSELGSLPMLGSKLLLEQLILSLLSNAIKSAGPEGAVDLSLSKKNNRAVLSVWDSGKSIPEDRLLNLFSPFQHSTLPRPNEGAGLDLWIAHRIAIFHHGVIMAGNRPNGGTEFTVSLPIHAPKQLRLQSTDTAFVGEDFSHLLVVLADALPRHAFDPIMEP